MDMNRIEELFYQEGDRGLLKVHDEVMFGDIPTPDWNDDIVYRKDEISFISVGDDELETSGKVKFYVDKQNRRVIVLWEKDELKVKLELITGMLKASLTSTTLWYIPALMVNFRARYPKGKVFGFYYKLDKDNRTPYAIIQDLIKQYEY